MRINMVDIGTLKGSNKEKKNDIVNHKKQEDFEGILHSKKANNNNHKNLDGNSKLKNYDESFKGKETVVEKSNQGNINQIEKTTKLETVDIENENFDIQELMAALFSVNKPQIIDVYDINKNNPDFLSLESSSLLNEITEVLTYSDDNFNNLVFDKNVDISELAKLEDKSQIENFLGNFVEKRNYVQSEGLQHIAELVNLEDDTNKKVKEIVIETLKSKGFNDADIKDLSIKIEAIKTNTSDKTLADNNIENTMVQVPIEKSSNIESKTFSNKDFDSEKKDNTEEKILTEIIEQDEISVFDTHMQRVRSFAKVEQTEDISVNRFNMKNDIKTAILHMGKTNMKELVVKINPDNLGEIAIKITSEGDNMKAMLKVSSKETYALLNNQDIKSFLINQDIKVSDVEISLYEDTTFFNGFDEYKENENNEKSKYQDGMHTEFIEFESDMKEEITLSSLDIII